MTVATVVTSLVKTGISVFLSPLAAVRSLHARPGSCASRGTFIAVLRLLLSAVVPLLVSLAQLQECFAYWMPWNTRSLLPVSFEYETCGIFCAPGNTDPRCQTRAGVPNCASTETTTSSATIDAPPLWRGTCASASYALFAPQATLMLAIQAVQVLVLAMVQWRAQRTVGEMIASAQQAALAHARRKGCCALCYRAPSDRAAWLPQRGQRVRSAVGVQARPQGHSVVNPLATAAAAGVQMTPAHAHCPGTDGSSSEPKHAAVHEAAAGSTGQKAPPCETGAPGGSGAIGDSSNRGSSAQMAKPLSTTFDSIQAHNALLVGAVFGAVYPAACLAAAAVTGAYALSWRLAPHAQTGDVPVPRWTRGAMLVVYTASVWFAYGPGSMLEGASAEGALVVLACVTALSCALLGCMVAPHEMQVQCKKTVKTWCSACCPTGRR